MNWTGHLATTDPSRNGDPALVDHDVRIAVGKNALAEDAPARKLPLCRTSGQEGILILAPFPMHDLPDLEREEDEDRCWYAIKVHMSTLRGYVRLKNCRPAEEDEVLLGSKLEEGAVLIVLNGPGTACDATKSFKGMLYLAPGRRVPAAAGDAASATTGEMTKLVAKSVEKGCSAPLNAVDRRDEEMRGEPSKNHVVTANTLKPGPQFPIDRCKLLKANELPFGTVREGSVRTCSESESLWNEVEPSATPRGNFPFPSSLKAGNEPIFAVANANIVEAKSVNVCDPNNNETTADYDHEVSNDEKEQKVIATKVTGTVKWFNAKSGYGFINRNDTKEEVFVHQAAIQKNNPKKVGCTVGDGEIVEFDVIISERGIEASNVTGPKGAPVKGPLYAADKGRSGSVGGKGSLLHKSETYVTSTMPSDKDGTLQNEIHPMPTAVQPVSTPRVPLTMPTAVQPVSTPRVLPVMTTAPQPVPTPRVPPKMPPAAPTSYTVPLRYLMPVMPTRQRQLAQSLRCGMVPYITVRLLVPKRFAGNVTSEWFLKYLRFETSAYLILPLPFYQRVEMGTTSVQLAKRVEIQLFIQGTPRSVREAIFLVFNDIVHTYFSGVFESFRMSVLLQSYQLEPQDKDRFDEVALRTGCTQVSDSVSPDVVFTGNLYNIIAALSYMVGFY